MFRTHVLQITAVSAVVGYHSKWLGIVSKVFHYEIVNAKVYRKSFGIGQGFGLLFLKVLSMRYITSYHTRYHQISSHHRYRVYMYIYIYISDISLGLWHLWHSVCWSWPRSSRRALARNECRMTRNAKRNREVGPNCGGQNRTDIERDKIAYATNRCKESLNIFENNKEERLEHQAKLSTVREALQCSHALAHAYATSKPTPRQHIFATLNQL